MDATLRPYVRGFRCGTSRPQHKLLAGICSDGFCVRVLEVALDVARRHTAWWLRRYPASLASGRISSRRRQSRRGSPAAPSRKAEPASTPSPSRGWRSGRFSRSAPAP